MKRVTTTVSGSSPKHGHAVFTTSGANGAKCEIAFDAPHVGTFAYCVQNRHQNAFRAGVSMQPSGHISLCQGKKCARNPDGHPLNVGKTVTVGPYQCTVMSHGVLCDIAATGRGFLIGGSGVQQVS